MFFQQEQEYSDRGGGSTTEGVFTALYDFTGQDSSQLTFKQGDQVCITQLELYLIARVYHLHVNVQYVYIQVCMHVAALYM